MEGILNRKVRNFITANHLLGADDRILVGLSGGADSVCLLLILSELGYDCLAAHCNFHLRGEESMRDEDFCRELCERVGVEFRKKDFDVEGCCHDHKESVEMACRRLRYDWWEEMLRDGDASVIAVGHHREDNVETFFLNLMRGSGIGGLKGMLPRTVNVVRPLLDCTKQEIVDYVSLAGESFVTDSSNLSNDYKRNRLRNVLLPEFEKVFPGAIDAVAKSMDYLRDNYDLYTDYSDKLRKKYIGNDGEIDLARLVSEEKNSRMILFELLSKVGMNMTQIDNILSSFTNGDSCPASGKIFRTSAITYLLDRGTLRPMSSTASYDSDPETEIVDLNKFPFSCRKMTANSFREAKMNGRLRIDALYMDSSVLDGMPVFELRGWRKGDRMIPFGMKGSRLVSDMFTDAKYSLDKKEKARLLTRDGQILWVIGLRTSDAFRVTGRSTQVLEVTFNG
ncbi:MAG: tRNA lysidine(34) synthetase TilS [Bacteroides sp.]|nr:tRNA lysidine(34) synthetase TilS [Bacteroides sp.]